MLPRPHEEALAGYFPGYFPGYFHGTRHRRQTPAGDAGRVAANGETPALHFVVACRVPGTTGPRPRSGLTGAQAS